MKFTKILLVAALILPLTLSAKSFKRGVGENQFSCAGQMSPLEPGVSWYYNWGPAAGTGYQNEVINFQGIEFVPMCWNGVPADRIRQHCATHPETKYILGFNEPNFTDQAHMTPQQAAEKWPEVVAIARELNLKIVAPAVNFSSWAPYQQPSAWMDEFVQLVGNDAFDYTAIHCYGGPELTKSLATEFWNKYHKPVWLTEFCTWPGGAGAVYVAPDAQMASMLDLCEWLEKSDFIFRYAWFKAIGAHDSNNAPNYGLMINQNGLGERELSPLGWAYVYMTDFDNTVWHNVGEVVPAKEYISSYNIRLNRTNDPQNPAPIELSQFSNGSHSDYQFNVASAGQHTLQLRVTGFGEPSRFNPVLRIEEVNENGNVIALLADGRQFTLPNSETDYRTECFLINLTAGHHIIRVADNRPRQPSGLRISTVQLVQGAAIATVQAEVNTPVNVYSIQGIVLRTNVSRADALVGLPAGFYIVEGKVIRNN